MQEANKEIVEKIRKRFIQELREFSLGSVHPDLKESALTLVADIEAGQPTIIGGRIFSELLDGAIEYVGVKLYSPEYHSIYKQLTVESQEQPKPPRHRTIERVVLETLPTGESIEQLLECDGISHRRCVDKVSYGADGNITFVEQISREELCPCDKKHP